MAENQLGVGRAFGSLGLLVGLVTGFTSSSVAASLLGMVFALIGGSTIAFFHKLEGQRLDFALRAIFAMSTACVIGLVIGVAICEWQVLSPHRSSLPNGTSQSNSSTSDSDGDTIAGRKYLRSHLVPAINAIDMEKQNGEITAETAYERLRAAVQKEGKTP